MHSPEKFAFLVSSSPMSSSLVSSSLWYPHLWCPHLWRNHLWYPQLSCHHNHSHLWRIISFLNDHVKFWSEINVYLLFSVEFMLSCIPYHYAYCECGWTAQKNQNIIGIWPQRQIGKQSWATFQHNIKHSSEHLPIGKLFNLSKHKKGFKFGANQWMILWRLGINNWNFEINLGSESFLHDPCLFLVVIVLV